MKRLPLFSVGIACLALAGVAIMLVEGSGQENGPVPREVQRTEPPDTDQYALQMIDEGRQTFRYDTFGDEAFWGDALRLHQAIAGERLGGVGPGVSPKTALEVGLKVDAEAIPPDVARQIQEKQV